MTSLPIFRPEPATTTDRLYRLADLIDLAQSNNPETRIAWEQAREAALRVASVRSLYLPTLTATVVGGRQYQSTAAQIANVSISRDAQIDGTVSNAALQWLLFDFGVRDALKRSAKDLSFASNISYNAVHQKIIYDVSRKFYDYTSARKNVGIAELSRYASARLLASASERYGRGVGTSVDAARARQMLAQSELNVIKARGAERDGYQALLAAIGITPSTAMRIEDVSGRPLSPASMEPVDRIVADAVRRRPDVQASYATARAATAGIAAAEAGFLPKIFLSASGSYTTGGLSVTSLPTLSSLTGGSSNGASGTSLDRSNATILGGIAIPIYDGGMREARLLAARSQADAAEAGVLRLQQNAATEIVSADNALRTSVATYRAATVLVQTSVVARDAAFSAYATGAGSVTAAIEAERTLLAGRAELESAHGTALIAAATLAFSAGRLTSSDVVDTRFRSTRLEFPR